MDLVLIITLPLTSIKNFYLKSVCCIIKTLKSTTKFLINFYEGTDECFDSQKFIVRKMINFILILIVGIICLIYAVTKISFEIIDSFINYFIINVIESIIGQCIIWPIIDTKKTIFSINSCITKYYKQKKHYLIESCQNCGSNSINYNNIVKSSELSNNEMNTKNTNINNNNNNNNNQLQKDNQTNKPLFKLYIKDTLFNKKLKFDIYKISELELLKCIYTLWKYSLKTSMILCGRWCVYNVTKIRDDDIDYYGGERYFWDRQKTNIEKLKFL